MLKYGIGIQDFRTLCEGGWAYVDKTEHIIHLLNTGKYYFFSRPRRFGKSLTVATMNELYSGDRELFRGLWAYDNWDFEAMRRPVVWLKFANLDYPAKGLYQALLDRIQLLAQGHGVSLSHSASLKDAFIELITELSERGRIVLLIDEYDKPIVDYLDEPEKVEQHRMILKQFYSVLKDSDPYLELVFITGVSTFSRVSIFSDLNNLTNLTLVRDTASLVGITQEELTHYFGEALDGLDAEHLRQWYNGYSWTGDVRVYNPFSLLSALRYRQIANFWFETGTPTFLVRLLRNTNRYRLHSEPVAATRLLNFDPTNPELDSLLFQTGYLTVDEAVIPGQAYSLRPPNQEVKQSLELFLLRDYREGATDDDLSRILRLNRALSTGDSDLVRQLLEVTLAGVPYDLWQQQGEHIFHALVHLTFSLLGTYVQSEVHTARGRCDALVVTEDYVYAFEFKIDQPAAEALRQIDERGYLDPYADGARARIAVGVSFSSTERTVADFASVGG